MSWQVGERITIPRLSVRNSSNTGIHSDEYAQRQGFERAVVAGPNFLGFVNTVTEKNFGAEWRRRGRLTARFVAPVYDEEELAGLIDVAASGEQLKAEWSLWKADTEQVVARGLIGWTPEAFEPTWGENSPEDELIELTGLMVDEEMQGTVVFDQEAITAYCARNRDDLHEIGRVPTSYTTTALFGPIRRLMYERGIGPGMWGEIDIRLSDELVAGRGYGYHCVVKARRRRKNLEFVDLEIAALDEQGTRVCEITHTQIIPQRHR